MQCISADLFAADTTRSPRLGEQDGREYNFTTKASFLELVDKNGFIEHAQFGDNLYGTSIKAIENIAEKGRICVLDIEMEVVSEGNSILLARRLTLLGPRELSKSRKHI